MKFTQALTDDNYREFYGMVYSVSNVRRYSILYGLIFMAMAFWAFLKSEMIFFIFLDVVGAILLTSRWRFINHNLKSARKNSAYGTPDNVEITDDRVIVDTGGNRTEWKMDMVDSYRSGESIVLLIMFEGRSALALLKSAMHDAGGEERLVEIFKGAGISPGK